MEGGFGSGLRAKLAGGKEEEPRSPAEAIAAADPTTLPDLELLRAELTASLAREQDLRSSLHEQVEVAGREVRLEQDVAGQAAALDARAASLAATEADLEERERQIAQRLAELDGALEEKEQLAKLEAQIAEREHLVDMKVHELKKADGQRANEAKEWKEKVEDLTRREKELAHAEARIGTARTESEKREEERLEEREQQISSLEKEAAQARAEVEAREQMLAKREQEPGAAAGHDGELAARARELDERELELTTKANRLAARMEQMEQEASGRA